uniref:Adenosine receptor A2a-like n=1 Tax=Saccoglossus kowalevskii TaxID=10224 RepID=A0ABM0GKD1_SACKO|nr:PREDICTED: adenosine receptor A2a-like [Saccoglossus kowalevskii]
MSVLVILTIMGNLLVIAAVYKNTNLQTITNYFIVSLAVTDGLIGFGTFPTLLMIQRPGVFYATGTCFMLIVLSLTPYCVSIYNLFAIAVDRYIAIIYPLHHLRWVTAPRAKAVIVLTWIASFLIMVGIVLLSKHSNYIEEIDCRLWNELIPLGVHILAFFTLFGIPLVIMIVMYIRIFLTARKQMRIIRAQLQVSGQETVEIHGKLKSAVMPCVVLGAFVVCWIPQLIFMLHTETNYCTRYSFNVVADIFVVMNSAINPLIYGWYNKEFRHAFKKMVII